VVAYYSDDAVSYNRNEEPLSGKEAIKKRAADRLAKDTTGNHNVYKVVDLFPKTGWEICLCQGYECYFQSS